MYGEEGGFYGENWHGAGGVLLENHACFMLPGAMVPASK